MRHSWLMLCGLGRRERRFHAVGHQVREPQHQPRRPDEVPVKSCDGGNEFPTAAVATGPTEVERLNIPLDTNFNRGQRG